jgi:PilZ domain
MRSAIPSSKPAQRRHPRTNVHVTVRWFNRAEEAVEAEILDVSAEGVFVVSADPLPDAVGPGDTVWVCVPSAAGSVTLTGTVRWRGYHPGHQLLGCGIQLEGRSLELIRKLVPSLHED